MDEWWALAGGAACATDQVLYNLARRGIEWDLLPRCRQRGMPIMAYSPLDQGRILRNRALKQVASRHEATPAQIALAWLLRQKGVMVIPKAVRLEHVRDNAAALDLRLTEADIGELDAAFPPPGGPRSLEML